MSQVYTFLFPTPSTTIDTVLSIVDFVLPLSLQHSMPNLILAILNSSSVPKTCVYYEFHAECTKDYD